MTNNDVQVKPKFTLYFHEVSKNYRVLVDGQVHPLLCGLSSVGLATLAAQTLFPETFNGFDNSFEGPVYAYSGGISAKANMIQEMKQVISILEATPAAEIDDFEFDIQIQFLRPKNTAETPQ